MSVPPAATTVLHNPGTATQRFKFEKGEKIPKPPENLVFHGFFGEPCIYVYPGKEGFFSFIGDHSSYKERKILKLPPNFRDLEILVIGG
ncbi:hypothetical protein C4569_00130 [Candidatus Parcubacteria bacterium]|nr:MAG: hypothetical protein C4569_00130 [Candidatus Parcubacteria bacterium]